MRFFVLGYGLLSYLIFLGTIVYAIGFVSGLGVPKTVDDGEVGAMAPSIAIDVGLLALFAIQHTIMARPTFKRWFTKFVPEPMERSTFVLLAIFIYHTEYFLRVVKLNGAV